jgi:hypothetical protein
MQKKKGQDAVDKLEAATLLALLSSASMPASMLTNDPYGACPGNPQGLFVGRFMSLKFAACSEVLQAGTGENAKAPGACAISTAVLAEMPTLPGT